MRKKTIVRLSILAVVLPIVALLIYVPRLLALWPTPASSLPQSTAHVILTVQAVLIDLLVVAAIVLGSIAWMGALVKQGRQEQWGWFVCTLLFGGLVLFIYLLAVPETPPQKLTPAIYVQVYQSQPPMYYLSNPPSYPSNLSNPPSYPPYPSV